jgi:hypothetical protein
MIPVLERAETAHASDRASCHSNRLSDSLLANNLVPQSTIFSNGRRRYITITHFVLVQFMSSQTTFLKSILILSLQLCLCLSMVHVSPACCPCPANYTSLELAVCWAHIFTSAQQDPPPPSPTVCKSKDGLAPVCVVLYSYPYNRPWRPIDL